VTGGSRGIGAATSLMLAKAGVDVGIGYRSRTEEAEALAAECRALGVRSFAQASDIGSAAGSNVLAARAKKEFGGIDIFVGNAGIWPVEEMPVAGMTDDRWANTMR
jgi:3-oxoacyl-[acyl-carrier protein] reductase